APAGDGTDVRADERVEPSPEPPRRIVERKPRGFRGPPVVAELGEVKPIVPRGEEGSARRWPLAVAGNHARSLRGAPPQCNAGGGGVQLASFGSPRGSRANRKAGGAGAVGRPEGSPVAAARSGGARRGPLAPRGGGARAVQTSAARRAPPLRFARRRRLA